MPDDRMVRIALNDESGIDVFWNPDRQTFILNIQFRSSEPVAANEPVLFTTDLDVEDAGELRRRLQENLPK